MLVVRTARCRRGFAGRLAALGPFCPRNGRVRPSAGVAGEDRLHRSAIRQHSGRRLAIPGLGVPDLRCSFLFHRKDRSRVPSRARADLT
ncbi:hypothetical protein HMPREF0724_12339 [Prescottella equi ATCC 33707]|uniref:Uncharacterized protein n=1 Tax=Prescottella equi ATCC 33707 TaxID=525370 RepID=E9T130_RHOHA|nr:hypothetical protein HMPREF0724_12339 [Prescottella equi ATCC 33707]